MMPEIGYSRRPVALGCDGMVAAAHPLAVIAGIEVLKSGGTAADAGIAVNAVLAVTQPYACGLGGDFFSLYYEAKSRRVRFLNGAGRSGSLASVEELRRHELRELPKRGPASVSVPGCVGAWGMLLERFGTRSLDELLVPAVCCAEAGFPTTPLVSQMIAECMPFMEDPEWHRIFAPRGRVPQLGELLRQADLARTLEALGREGPDLFYRGRIGEAIARRLKDEGFVILDDMANHSGEWGEPLTVDYRGFVVHQTSLPTQGLAALLALNLLESFNLPRLGFHSARHLHLLIEMVKLAYADRDRWIADPDYSNVAVDGVLAKDYAVERRKAFDPGKARFHPSADPTGDTTGFVIADRYGNMISGIQSLFGAFGSGVVPTNTGVVLHSRGSYFNTNSTHPNCLAPRKRPFHTLMAAIVTSEERPFMGFATMGGDGQAQLHVQVLTNVLDFGMDIQEAIERPRFLMGRFEPGESNDVLRLEGRVGRGVIRGLRRRGHRVEIMSEFCHRMGHGHGIVVGGAALMGGADARGDGIALGY